MLSKSSALKIMPFITQQNISIVSTLNGFKCCQKFVLTNLMPGCLFNPCRGLRYCFLVHHSGDLSCSSTLRKMIVSLENSRAPTAGCTPQLMLLCALEACLMVTAFQRTQKCRVLGSSPDTLLHLIMEHRNFHFKTKIPETLRIWKAGGKTD